MNTITNKLDQLEARLQSLIEGHIARLLPAQLSKDSLIRHMVAAMQACAIQREDESILSPDIFQIQIDELHTSGFPDLDRLIAELAEMIYQAGEQAGFQFLRYPTVSFNPDPEVDPKGIEIIARISQDFPSETLAHEVETNPKATKIPPNAFLIVDGKEVFTLEEVIINIGRRSSNDLVINDPRISRQHAQLRATNGRYVLFDLDSTGGTFVNNRRISQSTLYPGDVISLAGIPIVYAQDDALTPDQTQKYIHTTSLDDDQITTVGDL